MCSLGISQIGQEQKLVIRKEWIARYDVLVYEAETRGWWRNISKNWCFQGVMKMRYIFLLCCLCLVGCAPKVNCDDETQMLSSDRDVRYRWLQKCRTVDKKVRINGVEQVQQ